jgi:adenylate cyclase class IV
MKYKEIEFKYRADNISLLEFTEFCKRGNPKGLITASGYDYFYGDSKGSDAFARHRVGPSFNQLTFKRKTTDKNNFVRTEHNISLALDVTPEQTEALCKEFGYEFNFALFKNAFIYEFERYCFVFYVCYDTKLNELGRFIEIEMSESHPWASEQEAWDALTALEHEARPLGLSAQKRVRNSLFEMFKK